MSKTSGGVRGGGSSSGGNFTASVSVMNHNDETRWISKSFKTQRSAEQWIDKISSRFDSPAKSGFATWASIDKNTKRGTQYDIAQRDLAKEFEMRDRRAFKRRK